MATATKIEDWTAYAILQSHLAAAGIGLGLTIDAYDLIIGRLGEGDRINYLSGNAPDNRIVVKLAEQDDGKGILRHEIVTTIELVRDQYLGMVYDHATAAKAAIHELPAAMVDGLNLMCGTNWTGRVRLILNQLTTVNKEETSFPRTIGQFMGACDRQLPIDHWRDAHVELKQRLKEIEACAPKKTSPVTDNDASAATRAIELLLGEESHEILKIARSNKTAEDRYIAVCGIDNRLLHWKAPEIATLLSLKEPITAAAIRGLKFWKVDRNRAIAAACGMRDEDEVVTQDLKRGK